MRFIAESAAFMLRYNAFWSLLYDVMINILNKLFKKKKKKLGLALGSGGAKGMAHVGILRAFDEEGISFDCVAGTSIGSVIGAMYAAGYSSASMIKYLDELDFFAAQTIVKLTLTGKSVEDIFGDVIGGSSFDDLLIPFAAVATDLKTGEEVVIKSGSVAKAMRASSAIPPVLKPASVNGKMLIDGAYVNSVPSDVVKNMGADIVIGVNLSAHLPFNDRIKAALDEKYPDNGVKICDRAMAGRVYSDVLLTPDLQDYSSATVSKAKLNEIYEIGYETAKSKMSEITGLLKKNKIEW